MFSCILHGWNSRESMCPICSQSQEVTTAGDLAREFIYKKETPPDESIEQPNQAIDLNDLIKEVKFHKHGLVEAEQSKFYNMGLDRAISIIKSFQNNSVKP